MPLATLDPTDGQVVVFGDLENYPNAVLMRDRSGTAVILNAPSGDTIRLAIGDTDILNVSSSLLTLPQNDFVISNGFGAVIGNSAQVTFNALIPEFQVLGSTVGVDGALAVALYSSTAANGPQIILARSKSATLGTNTIVANADVLGAIAWMGADGGSGFDPAATIVCEVDGTPGAATDMPGLVRIQTSPDGSQTPATVLTCRADRSVEISNGSPKLTMGTVSAFSTTKPTNTLVFREGTAPAGAITTAGGLFSSATVVRKIIADGTVSNVET